MVSERVMTPVGSKGYRAYEVEEFSVRNGVIVLELVNSSNQDKRVHLQYPLSKQETAMPTLKIVSEKVNYPEGIAEIDKETLPVKLVYGDGTQVSVDYMPDDVTVSSVGEDIYTISVGWKGMTAVLEVTADADWSVCDVFSNASNWMYAPIKYVYNNGYMGELQTQPLNRAS